MSKLPKKAIEEYKAIYKKEFGKDISDVEAEEQGMRQTEVEPRKCFFRLRGRIF